ncbi:MAG: hypothetical protein HKN03_17185 [Acidimicrobiales bacterium]|nr:hypothetical protein [Acidimicrobiales bacterium]
MRGTGVLLVELLVLFVGVSFLVEIFQRRFGPERLKAWMGGAPIVSALKGTVIGFITPFCTYSAVPLLLGMIKAQVPPAGYIAFISAAPVLDPILFGALWLIVGPIVAMIYVLVTLIAAVGLALVAQHVGVDRHLKPLDKPTAIRHKVAAGGPPALEPDSPIETSCSKPPDPWQGWPAEAQNAIGASARLMRSFGPLLLLGVAVGVGIEAVISPETAASVTTGAPWISIPTAAAIGTPLYSSTELFIPIANSLHNAGAGVGAIVALTIAGAGANVPEFIVLSKMAKPAVVSIFFGYVFTVAMTGGLLAHTLS